MITEQINRSNKAAFFCGWCGCWSLAAGVFALVTETIAMSRATMPLPLDRREYVVIAGFAGIVAGAINGAWSGLAILLGLWLKRRLRSNGEPISRYSAAGPAQKLLSGRKSRIEK